MNKPLALSFIVLLTAAACSSSKETGSSSGKSEADTGSSSGKSEADVAETVCDAYSKPTCETPEEIATRRNKCLSTDGLCMARIFRSEALAPFIDCMKKRVCTKIAPSGCDCDKSDDACFREAGQSLPANPVRDQYERACHEKRDACGSSGSFVDDWCTTGDSGYEVYSDTTYEALRPCFALECGNNAIGKCLSDKFKELNGDTC